MDSVNAARCNLFQAIDELAFGNPRYRSSNRRVLRGAVIRFADAVRLEERTALGIVTYRPLSHEAVAAMEAG